MATELEPRPVTAYSYYVVAALAIVATMSSIDRTLISTVAEPIRHEFGLNDSQLGVVTGLLFAVSFTLCGVPIGMLIDRVRRTYLLAGLLALWSGLTVLSGFAQSLLQLGLARIGVGASESGGAATSMSIIADYFPVERRGSALSLYYLSTPTGVALGFAFGSLIAGHLGWRAAFLFGGVPGLVLSLVILLTLREPVRGGHDRTAPLADKPSFRACLATLFRVRPLLYLLLGGVLATASQSGLSAFMTPFMMRIHGVSIQHAGVAIAIAQIIGGYGGVLVGGLLTDRLAPRSPGSPAFAVAILIWLAAPAAVAVLLVGSWQLSIALLTLQLFLNFCYYAPHFATFVSLCPPQMRGTLTSIQIVLMTLVGYGLGPVIAGVSSDFFHRLGVENPLRWGMVVSSCLFLVAGACYLAASRAIKRSADAIPEVDPAARWQRGH
ncbi:MAG: MFS transporter [Sphingomonas sp.]